MLQPHTSPVTPPSIPCFHRSVTPADRRLLVALALPWLLLGLLLMLRVSAGGRLMVFLLWNAFLALIPLAAAWLARFLAPRQPALATLVAALWLPFFPNAPYLITDLLHLRSSPPKLLPEDVLIFGTAAAAGLLAGLVSLRWVVSFLAHRGLPRLLQTLFTLFMFVAGAFGVYLGRFQRWNSWDIVSRPSELLADAWAALQQVHAFRYTLVFALVLAVSYYALNLITPPLAPSKHPPEPAPRT